MKLEPGHIGRAAILFCLICGFLLAIAYTPDRYFKLGVFILVGVGIALISWTLTEK